MKTKIIILSMLLLIVMQCGSLDSLIGSDDARLYLEPKHIVGEWVRIVDEPSDVSGLFRKDTTIYRIGLDSLPYDGPENKEYPLTFYIKYDKGNRYGYIHEPEEGYDYDREISYLTYRMILGLPEKTTEERAVFSMPQIDSLTILIGSETIGVRKKKIP